MLKVADYKPQVLNTCLRNVFQLYQDGKLKPISGGEFTQETFFDAHDLLESGKSSGKLIVKW
jgi:NADPH2:quinone reductase